MGWLLAGQTAWAETVFRCDAVWLQTTRDCPVTSTLAATGMGSGEGAAREAALDRLAALMRSQATVQTIQAPARPADPALCAAAAVAHGRVDCMSSEGMAEKRHCYIDFAEEGCPSVPMFEKTGRAWKVSEKGRDYMCAQLDVALRRADPFTRHRCRAACLQTTRVRCPAKKEKVD